ncbi:class I SAM-dependent methyltransferase [Sphaerisporangium viridialbum]|uniref:class I SAM-dependent methyltransferase n=1 Tax=Sphaerisporangium viridialbum TaxID=46189 RepID=UPI003C766C35
MTIYDRIGTTYTATRRPDARIAARIARALGDARTVVNVGAGAGSYEPPQTVLAVEPSTVMIGQRPDGAAPAVRARAEALPLADGAADAVMAILTVHHWTDLETGLAELRRVARRRVVVLTWDQSVTRRFWLLSEYLPEAAAFDDNRAVPVERLSSALGGARVETVPVPRDCTDGFGAAYWCRPEAYLDPGVRAGMSVLAQTGEDILQPGLTRLAADLSSGDWYKRHTELMKLERFDAGYRLLVTEVGPVT